MDMADIDYKCMNSIHQYYITFHLIHRLVCHTICFHCNEPVTKRLRRAIDGTDTQPGFSANRRAP